MFLLLIRREFGIYMLVMVFLIPCTENCRGSASLTCRSQCSRVGDVLTSTFGLDLEAAKHLGKMFCSMTMQQPVDVPLRATVCSNKH